MAVLSSVVDVVGHTLETLLGGRNVTRFKKGVQQYDVTVQVEDAARRTPGQAASAASTSPGSMRWPEILT